MPTIRIIVPVYKVEAYLDRCVESILNQTYRDFELILVDDGSPDNCGAMCDSWAAKDSRVIAFHKENGGVSAARNAGMDIARGEWITFIDSDDYIHPQMLDALYSAVMEHGVKVAACGYSETAGEPLVQDVDTQARICAPQDFYTQRCTNATVPWGKLYHRDVVLPYPVGKLHEDEYVTYRILFACEKIAVIDTALYGYYQNDSGITRSQWTPRRMDIFYAFEQRVDFFQANGYAQLAEDHAFRYIWDVQRQMALIMQLTRRERRIHLKTCRNYLHRAVHKAKAVTKISSAYCCRIYSKAYPFFAPVLRLAGLCYRIGDSLRRLKNKH